MPKRRVSSYKTEEHGGSRECRAHTCIHGRALADLLFTKRPFHFHTPQRGWDSVDFFRVSFWPHSALQNKIIPFWGFGEELLI